MHIYVHNSSVRGRTVQLLYYTHDCILLVFLCIFSFLLSSKYNLVLEVYIECKENFLLSIFFTIHGKIHILRGYNILIFFFWGQTNFLRISFMWGTELPTYHLMIWQSSCLYKSSDLTSCMNLRTVWIWELLMINRNNNSLEYGQCVTVLWSYNGSQCSSMTAMVWKKTRVWSQLLLLWKSPWNSKYCDIENWAQHSVGILRKP